jgi:hypothetical protein
MKPRQSVEMYPKPHSEIINLLLHCLALCYVNPCQLPEKSVCALYQERKGSNTLDICCSFLSLVFVWKRVNVKWSTACSWLWCIHLYLVMMVLWHHCRSPVQIHTSLINGRPSADQLTSELLDFTSARYIRLRLQRIRTLNADLMTLSYRDPKEVDPIVTRRVRVIHFYVKALLLALTDCSVFCLS